MLLDATTQDPEFYHVPDKPTLAISKDGRVLDLVRNVVLEEVVRFDGYRRVKTIGYGELHIHRMLAEAFLVAPGLTSDLVVNHKDGYKLNLDLNNLEWVTSSGNAVHAYVTGLRPDNREVESMDLITGDVKRYYSLNECARNFGVNGEVVHRYLNGGRRNTFCDKFTLRYVGYDWPDITQIAVGGPMIGGERALVADNGKEVVIFPSVASAARMLEIKAPTIYYHANRPDSGGTKGWKFAYFDSVDLTGRTVEHSGVSGVVKPIAPVRKPVPIRVTDTETGAITKWDSTEAFALSVGSKKNTIQKAVLVNGGSWRKFKVEYLE